jgi:hypothetical protein
VKLSGPQLIALYDLKGTGRYVGKDAQMKTRLMNSKYRLRTLLALRRKGLIEHYIACQWYLTDEGREWVRAGRLS